MRPLTLVRHQRKGPHRPTGGDGIRSFHGPIDNATYARKYRNVLPALVGVGNGRRIDAGTGLEFPQRFSRRLVQGDELAVQAPSEQQTAIGREHAGGNHSSGHWHFPFRLAGQRIKRHVIAPRLACRRRAEARLDASRALTEDELKFRVFQNPGNFPGVHIDEPGLWVEMHWCRATARFRLSLL